MGGVRMADISEKGDILREAVAFGEIRMRRETVELIRGGRIEKGDPLYAAEIAAIMAAKNASQIIPLCHPIQITHVQLEHRLKEDSLEVRARVRAESKTGVEMEALAAVSAFLLTVWDMVKKYEKDEEGQYPFTEIRAIRVERKRKGEGLERDIRGA
ncbi:MAG: cyclic pyranopterin monophosphate synthase MoaC [Candidatus Bathyarchaeia archaeon]